MLNIMDSFKQYLLETKLAKTTIAAHNRNLDTLGNILLSDIDIIIQYLKTTFTVNQIYQLNKTISKYLDFNDRTKDRVKLLEFATDIKTQVAKHQLDKTKNIKTKIEDGELKTIKQLYDALDVLYDTGQYKKYIVNYILLNYHTRNLDLDLTITFSRKYMNSVENYLLVRKTKVEFIRNNYKTVDLYGEKIYTNRDPRFVYACLHVGEMKLLHTSNIGREVKSMTIDNLSESEINKIAMYALPANKIEYMSKSRGTSVQVLLDSYNPNKI